MTVLGPGPGPEDEKLENFCGSGSEKLGPSATLPNYSEFEVDSLCAARADSDNETARRIKCELLKQMDGIEEDDDAGVIVIGATNTPWVLDKGFLR